jgi:NADP-dependent 3-hydroxy acid dehydrogenase YdfG
MTPNISLSLAGRVAVVTGASSGMGAATARRLAAGGASVALLARRADRLDALADSLRSTGAAVLPVPTDVSDRAALDAAATRVAEELGPVDLVVANAGLMPLAPIVDRRADDWDRMIAVNLGGVLAAVHAFVGQLVDAAAAGRVADLVTISSLAAQKAMAKAAVYGATKAAVTHLAANLRIELSPLGVRVTNIEPGATDTELRGSIGDPDVLAWLDDYLASTTVLQPENVADLVGYVAEQPAHVNFRQIVITSTAEV